MAENCNRGSWQSTMADPSPIRTPNLLRLHGDLWNNNLVNDPSTERRYPAVRLKAVRQLPRQSGLIVVGYSGSDRRIMNELFAKLGPDDFTGGLLWCVAHPPNQRVQELLGRVHPNAFLVEIESFQSLMNQLWARLQIRKVLRNDAEYIGILTSLINDCSLLRPDAITVYRVLETLSGIWEAIAINLVVSDQVHHWGNWPGETEADAAAEMDLFRMHGGSNEVRRMVLGEKSLLLIRLVLPGQFAQLATLLPNTTTMNDDDMNIIRAILRLLAGDARH